MRMQMLARARELTDDLFRLVRPDSMYERPIPERHRIVFYLGHLEAFDWNLLGRYALDRPPFQEEFDRLFAFGIDPPPGKLPDDRPSDWPSVAEVETYCRRVREEIDRLDIPDQLRHVAVEHRLMHAETFTYILHQLPYERKIAPPSTQAGIATRTPDPSMIPIPDGPARLGRTPAEGFGWDNEFDA